ncbi:hypothetical protein BH18ACT3_BH18ACT3_21880 [soil metagenome]|jgi:hypothetical protein
MTERSEGMPAGRASASYELPAQNGMGCGGAAPTEDAA